MLCNIKIKKITIVFLIILFLTFILFTFTYKSSCIECEQSQSGIKITWEEHGDASYQLSRLASYGTEWVEIATLPPGTTSYLDTDVSNHVSYKYCIDTFWMDGEVLVSDGYYEETEDFIYYNKELVGVEAETQILDSSEHISTVKEEKTKPKEPVNNIVVNNTVENNAKTANTTIIPNKTNKKGTYFIIGVAVMVLAFGAVVYIRYKKI